MTEIEPTKQNALCDIVSPPRRFGRMLLRALHDATFPAAIIATERQQGVNHTEPEALNTHVVDGAIWSLGPSEDQQR